MLDQVSNRVINILIFLVLVMIVTTGLFYGVIFVTFTPQAPLELGLTQGLGPSRLVVQPVPPTATPEQIPPYPPPWTPEPTHTPLSSPTPTPKPNKQTH